ncbi:MAG: DDE-type integrase/transposase/recombinase [Candidatus Poribacteria bacterium]|nr:DDE-type integrase/transposase/recombinase [Candidatus Poribacteria bacterium]
MGDITYVRLNGHFVYLALLMDVFTRMIRGWKLSQHLTQSLMLETLEQALHDRVPEMHHSDQGVQYLSSAYLLRLKAHGIQVSVTCRGDLGERLRRKVDPNAQGRRSSPQ